MPMTTTGCLCKALPGQELLLIAANTIGAGRFSTGGYVKMLSAYDCPSVIAASTSLFLSRNKPTIPASWHFCYTAIGYNGYGLGSNWGGTTWQQIILARLRKPTEAIVFADCATSNYNYETLYGGYYAIEDGNNLRSRHLNRANVT